MYFRVINDEDRTYDEDSTYDDISDIENLLADGTIHDGEEDEAVAKAIEAETPQYE